MKNSILLLIIILFFPTPSFAEDKIYWANGYWLVDVDETAKSCTLEGFTENGDVFSMKIFGEDEAGLIAINSKYINETHNSGNSIYYATFDKINDKNSIFKFIIDRSDEKFLLVYKFSKDYLYKFVYSGLMEITSNLGRTVITIPLTGSAKAIETLKQCNQGLANKPSAKEIYSPLKSEEIKLLESDDLVLFQFLKNNISNVTYQQFQKLIPFDKRRDLARELYYKKSVKMATIAYRNNADFVGFLNALFENNVPSTNDIEKAMIKFEKVYYQKFGRYPLIIPVDVDELTARVLADVIAH